MPSRSKALKHPIGTKFAFKMLDKIDSENFPSGLNVSGQEKTLLECKARVH